MTSRNLPSINRRSLIARSAAASVFAGLLHRQVFAGQASPSPVVERDAIAELVAGNTSFALDLYRQYREGVDGNVVFSPYSISLALAMVYAGARGDTADQIADVLALPLPGPDTHAAFQALTADIDQRGNVEDVDGQGVITIANALWGEESFPFSDSFIKELETYYGAGLQLVDFQNDPEGARQEINDWVAEKTVDHITEIIPEGAITAVTRLVLANAIYFASNWRSTFDLADTRDDTFHLVDGSTVDAPFMQQTTHFPYVQTDLAHVVELPYVADGFAMTIILPDEGQFDAVEKGLDADALAALVDPLESTKVELHLPTFEFDLGQDLVEILQALGMTDVFDKDRADLTGMVDESSDERLMVSDVLHKAFISIDEEGTEAAAATTVIVGVTSAPAPEPEEPVVLKLDRPFLFAIRDTDTGTVLFLGRVMDPGGE